MEDNKKIRMPKKNIIILTCLSLVVCVALGILVFTGISKAESRNAARIRKELADSDVTEVSLSGKIELTEPLEVTGKKNFVGKGTIKAADNFESEDISALMIVKEGADLTLGGSVKLSAKGVDCGVYAEKDTTLTVTEDAVLEKAGDANIYSLGEVTQKGGMIKKGFDNVYIAKAGSFLWEKGKNEESVNHGIHIEEGATLKATSRSAMMKDAGAEGIYLQGDAVIDDIFLLQSVGNQINVAKKATLTLNGGEIAYGLKNGIVNKGELVMNGGKIYDSAISGVVNSNQFEMVAGSILTNKDKGICNKSGGKLTIVNKAAKINGNEEGIVNEESAVCELTKATVSGSLLNNVVNLGEMNIYDITLLNSKDTGFVSQRGAKTTMRNVVVDGAGKNYGINNSGGAVIDIKDVVIKNVVGGGILNIDGDITGSNVTIEASRKYGITSQVHTRLGGGTITLENVKMTGIATSAVNMDPKGAGVVNITNGVFGETESNSLSVKGGELNLTNVEIQGHVEGSPDNVHGVYLTGGKLNFKNCSMTNIAGSGIRNNGGIVVADNLTISNVVGHNIFASLGSTTLNNCTLEASDYYHAYARGGDVNLNNCILKSGTVSNLSMKTGGIINVKNCTLGKTQSNSIIVSEGGILTMKDTKMLGHLDQNTPSIHGIYAPGGKVVIDNVAISNTASAALRNKGGNITATNLTVSNIIGHNIDASDGGKTVVKNSTLAASDYYHAYCKGGSVLIENCTLQDGTRSNLSVRDAGTIIVNKSTLGKTRSNAIIVSAGGTLKMTDTKLLGHLDQKTASIHGIYVPGGKVVLNNVSISNSASAALRNKGGDITATNLTVSNIIGHNIDASDGGSTVVRNSTLAASDYYHVYCKGGSVLIDNCTLKEGVIANLSVPAGGTVNVKDSTLEATTSHNVLVTGGTVNLTNTKVLGQVETATGSLYGVYAKAGKVNIKNTLICNTANSAIRNTDDANDLKKYPGAEITATGLTVKNIADRNVFASAGKTVIKNSTLAPSTGYHIHARTKGEVVIENCTLQAGAPRTINVQDGVKVTVKNSTLEDTATNVVVTGGDVDFIDTKVLGQVDLTGGDFTVKGKVSAKQVAVGKGCYIGIDGVLKSGSNLYIVPQVTETGTVIAKSANTSDMTANMQYLQLMPDAAARGQLLAQDGSNAIINEAAAAAFVARYNGTEYATINDAIDAIVAKGTKTATIEIIDNARVESAIVIPTGYNITIKDDGTQRRIYRHSSLGNASMFVLEGKNSKLTFTATSADDENCTLIVDGAYISTTVPGVATVGEGTALTVNKGVNFCNHKASGDTVPGLFKVHKTTLTIKGGVYENNQGQDGGIAYTSGQSTSKITVTGGTFRNNLATGGRGGGAFCVNADSTLSVTKGTFENNYSSKYGGAIVANYNGGGTKVTLVQCTFTNNKAALEGGAINMANSVPTANKYTLTVNACQFTGNTAGVKGNDIIVENVKTFTLIGAQKTPIEIYLNGASEKVTVATTFKPADAVKVTLAATMDKALAGSTFATCSSATKAAEQIDYFVLGGELAKGYKLRVAGKDLVLDDVAAKIGNTAYSTIQEAVDAIGANGKGTVTVIGEALKETVKIPAGADITLIDDGTVSTITRDTSLTGEMFTFEADSNLTIASTGTDEDCKLIIDGGAAGATASIGMLVENNATLTVKAGVKFCNHTTSTTTASNYMGTAVKVHGATLNIEGGVFENNTGRTGGVVYTSTHVDNVVNVTGGTFRNNRSTYGGVFCINANSVLNISNALFEDNSVTTSGSVIYASHGVAAKVTVKNSIFKNNVTEIRGAAIAVGYAGSTDNKAQLSISGCTFTGNECTGVGPGVKDVYVENVEPLTLDGTQATPVEICLAGSEDTITLAKDFKVTGNGQVTVTPVSGTKQVGDTIVKCVDANQVQSVKSHIELGGGFANYTMKVSGATIQLGEGTVTAMIGDQKYYSLQQAVDAIGENGTGTIKVLGEKLKATVTIPTGANVTITDDGQQRTITRASSWKESKAMFALSKSSVLTFASTGTDDDCKLIIDGANVNADTSLAAQVAEGTSLYVKEGVKFCNHKTSSETVPGVFKVHKGTLNIQGGVFENNQAESGGVAYTSGQETSIINVTGGTFRNNTSTNHGGGAFCVNAKATLTVLNAEFENNKATTAAGGAILANFSGGGTKVSIVNSTFKKNSAKTAGGAIVVGSSSATAEFTLLISGCKFEGNTAQTTGNDVHAEKLATFTLGGLQTTPMELYLGTADQITVDGTFAANGQGKVVLTMADAKAAVGEVIANCANDDKATEVLSCFKLDGNNLTNYKLITSGTDIVLGSK